MNNHFGNLFLGKLLLTVAVFLVSMQALAQESREPVIKAAYLYNLGVYCTWPDSSFKDEKDHFVIGIVGTSSSTPYLQRIASKKKIKGRPISVKFFKDSSEIAGCHLVYMASSVADDAQQEFLKKAGTQPTLLVGEDSDYLADGGHIQFVRADNKIRLQVLPTEIKKTGLSISSKLLQVSDVINARPAPMN